MLKSVFGHLSRECNINDDIYLSGKANHIKLRYFLRC